MRARIITHTQDTANPQYTIWLCHGFFHDQACTAENKKQILVKRLALHVRSVLIARNGTRILDASTISSVGSSIIVETNIKTANEMDVNTNTIYHKGKKANTFSVPSHKKGEKTHNPLVMHLVDFLAKVINDCLLLLEIKIKECH